MSLLDTSFLEIPRSNKVKGYKAIDRTSMKTDHTLNKAMNQFDHC